MQKNKGNLPEVVKKPEEKCVVPSAKKLEMQPEFSVENVIISAIKQGLPVETMEKILAMRKELKEEKAKEEFDNAMANFQMHCPEIKKNKVVRDKSGSVLYTYASIDEIVNKTKKLLAENGLSYSIKTEKTANGVKSICIIKHRAGHSEQSEMEVPLGNQTGIMSASQVMAGASTFSKRYAFCNALGIMTSDEDREEVLTAGLEEIENAKALLNKCMDEKTLTKTFLSLSKALKANKDVIAFASGIKGNILSAKKNENA